MIQSSEAMIYVPELNLSAVTCMSYNNHNEHTSTRVAYTQYTLLMQAHAFARGQICDLAQKMYEEESEIS